MIIQQLCVPTRLAPNSARSTVCRVLLQAVEQCTRLYFGWLGLFVVVVAILPDFRLPGQWTVDHSSAAGIKSTPILFLCCCCCSLETTTTDALYEAIVGKCSCSVGRKLCTTKTKLGSWLVVGVVVGAKEREREREALGPNG